MANEKIKRIMRVNNITTWQLGDILGVSEQTVYRKFRHELTDDEQERIIKMIRKSIDEGGCADNG